MENQAQGQIVLDVHRSAPFEHRMEEAYLLPANDTTINTVWKSPVREMLASLRGMNWVKPDIKHNPVIALFCFTGCAIGISLMAMAALLTSSPFVFPSLGPTAFLFFSSPTAPVASPRNVIIGHTIGVLVGYFSLVVTGLTTAGPALQVGVTIPRIIAIALSLSLTGGLMVLLRAPHPPAGATTLIISLGTLAKPWQLEVLMGAVILLTMFAVLFNRLVGIPYPLWKNVSPEASDKMTVESDLQACIIGNDSEGSKMTVDSDLQACIIIGNDSEEGSSDTNLCSSETYSLIESGDTPQEQEVSYGQFSKREGLSRIKSTHVRLIPLNAGW